MSSHRVIHYSSLAPRPDPSQVHVTVDGADHLLAAPIFEGELVVPIDGALPCWSCRKQGASFKVIRDHAPLGAWTFACNCGVTLIVKRAPPSVPRALRGLCGHFSTAITSTPELVTCRTCARLAPQVTRPTTPAKTEPKTTMRTTISALLALTLAAACGTPELATSDSSETTAAVDSTSTSDPDPTTSSGSSTSGDEDTGTSSTSTGESTSVTTDPSVGTLDDAGLPLDSTSTSSTDDASTSSTSTDSSGGDTTGEGTASSSSEGGVGEPVICYGDPCSAVGCAAGMMCIPHWATGLAVCVSPCTVVAPDEPCLISAFVCSEDVGQDGVCKMDDTGAGWCFPT